MQTSFTEDELKKILKDIAHDAYWLGVEAGRGEDNQIKVEALVEDKLEELSE